VRLLGQGLLLVCLVSACRAGSARTRSDPHLEIHWNGSGRGKLSAPASAEWCAARRLLEIRAIQGDTGIALALYPAESLTSGSYRIVEPAKAESLPPAAGVALRWLTQTAVQGFQGDSGAVVLERSAEGLLSGHLRARARSVADAKRITVTGEFRDLTMRPESPGCAPAAPGPSAAEPGDTGVH
jgi:hypothetical protein